jgi:hypothetical protein
MDNANTERYYYFKRIKCSESLGIMLKLVRQLCGDGVCPLFWTC